jgi:hypothetical protein
LWKLPTRRTKVVHRVCYMPRCGGCCALLELALLKEGKTMSSRSRDQVLQMLLVIEAVKEAVEKFEAGEANLADTFNAISSAMSLRRAA